MSTPNTLVERVLDHLVRVKQHKRQHDESLEYNGYSVRQELPSPDGIPIKIWTVRHTERALNGEQEYELDVLGDDLLDALMSYLEERGI